MLLSRRTLFGLNLALLLAWPVAWTAPLARAGLLPFFQGKEVSIIGGLGALWEADALLAILVFLFAILMPVAKIAALGLLLALIAVAGFVSRKTTVNPHKPEKTSALVTDGVYAFTRNPMYLELVLIAAGAALMQAAPLGLAFALLAGWYITEFQIKPEEAALRDIFGDEFETYSKRVRRWI